MAGAIAELAKKALAADFRSIDPRDARIVLVEAGAADPCLPSTRRSPTTRSGALETLGVEVVLNRAVTECDAAGVALGDERIESRTVIWAAGVRASPAGKWLDAETDRAGRVIVNPDLTVPGHPEIFVIGDTALVKGENGNPLPGVATVAKQEGKYVAKAARIARSRQTGPAVPLSRSGLDGDHREKPRGRRDQGA